MKNRGTPRSTDHRGFRAAAFAAALLAVAFLARSGVQLAEAQTPAASPAAPTSSAPEASPSAAPAEGVPGESPAPLASALPSPAGAPTQPPIIVEPPSAGVVPGGTQVLRVLRSLGTLTLSVA